MPTIPFDEKFKKGFGYIVSYIFVMYIVIIFLVISIGIYCDNREKNSPYFLIFMFIITLILVVPFAFRYNSFCSLCFLHYNKKNLILYFKILIKLL